MTQEEFARRLGVSGKSVVSGWETGATKCEGPAAELVLLLFGDAPGAAGFEALAQALDTTWRRSGNCVEDWRQVAFVPTSLVEIERQKFVELFPGVAIPHGQYPHGFPFTPAGGLPPQVMGSSGTAWTGSIPAERERAPRYAWTLTRSGTFAFRERVWEADGSSRTGGHTHIRSLLVLALAGSHFLARFAKQLGMHTGQGFALRLDLEGMSGRGIVTSDPASMVEEPDRLFSESRVAVTTTTTVEEVLADPVRVGLELVGEVALIVNPELARDASLRRHLKAAVELDKSSQFRDLGFIAHGKK